jgi:hypothetical protein
MLVITLFFSSQNSAALPNFDIRGPRRERTNEVYVSC